jgi:hypothetical protein
MNRLLALSALPLVLAAGMLGASGTHRLAVAAAQPSPTCVLVIVCLPGSSSSPTPSPSSPAPTPSPTSASPSPTSASPSPTSASPSPTASPSASPGPVPSPSGGGPGPTGSGMPSASPSPSPSPSASRKRAAAKLAAATPGLVASSATTVLTAGSATLAGFTYAGNVDMPVAGGGTVTMMEFTADSMTLAGGVTDSVTQLGLTSQTSSPELDFGGSVTLYATSLSGSLLGVPVTFTPSTASQILLSLANLITGVVPITLTDVTTDQPLVSAGSLQTSSLSMGFGG